MQFAAVRLATRVLLTASQAAVFVSSLSAAARRGTVLATRTRHAGVAHGIMNYRSRPAARAADPSIDDKARRPSVLHQL